MSARKYVRIAVGIAVVAALWGWSPGSGPSVAATRPGNLKGSKAGSPAAATEPPAIPDNVRTTEIEPGSFTVTWDPVDDTREIFYEVQRVYQRPDGTSFPLTVRVMEGETVTFSAIWGGTYDVMVRSRTWFAPVLFSDWSDPLRVTTPLPEGYALPSAPTNLRVERNAAGVVEVVRWDAPTQGTEPLKYTVVSDHPSTYIGGFTSELSIDADRLLLNFEDFQEPGLTLRLWVKAKDLAANESPLSEPLELVCCPF